MKELKIVDCCFLCRHFKVREDNCYCKRFDIVIAEYNICDDYINYGDEPNE